MKRADALKRLDDFQKMCDSIFISKGSDYSVTNTDDELGSFKDGEWIGVNPMQKWAIFYSKHESALRAYIKNGGQVESEPIAARIMDLVNYLRLLYLLEVEAGRIDHEAFVAPAAGKVPIIESFPEAQCYQREVAGN